MSDHPMIAVIDDDDAVRMATENLVRSLGYKTTTFGSAEEFLNSPEAAAASCLISDVQMPGMSGVELQAHLLARGRSVPMIFITAFPEDHVRQKACAAGAIGFLTKPFDGDIMVECIDKALASRH